MESGNPRAWQEEARNSVKEVLRDPIVSRLLERSCLSIAQFETLLIDQLGVDMANKALTREEMARILRKKGGISRGAMNRTLGQARKNISESIHTILLLGYAGLFESPSLAPFVEASEQLRSQSGDLREVGERDPALYRAGIEALFESLEEAFQAIYGKTRDM